jgi:hypothetical protein
MKFLTTLAASDTRPTPTHTTSDPLLGQTLDIRG